MGNEQSSPLNLSLALPNGAGSAGASLKDLKHLLKSTCHAFESFRAEKEGRQPVIDDVGSDAKAKKRHKHKTVRAILKLFKLPSAENAVGTKCVTWISGPVDEPSFSESTVVAVKTGDDATASKFVVVLSSGLELDVDDLSRSVERAQAAIAVEKDWLAKLRQANIFEGSAIDLWMSADDKHNDADANHEKRIRRSMSQRLRESPRAHRHGGSISRDDDKNQVNSTDDDDKDNTAASDSGAEGADDAAAFSDQPMNLFTYTVSAVRIRWNYQDAEVQLVARRQGPDGTPRAEEEVFSGEVALGMMQAAQPARERLDRLLRRISVHEGVAAGARVDLWLEEPGVAVRAVVLGVGHRFTSPTDIELQPLVKYAAPTTSDAGQDAASPQPEPTTTRRQTVTRLYGEYASFITSWKQAKYVTEQQAMLAQDARVHGVAHGAWVCVEQAAKSVRWPFKKSGSLDAQVEELAFDFDRDLNEVTLRVLTRYRTQGFRGKGSTREGDSSSHGKQRRRIALPADAVCAREWTAWNVLRPLLRSKVTVSDVRCSGLTAATRKAFRPYIKFVLGDSKRKTPPAILALDHNERVGGRSFDGQATFGVPSNWEWDGQQCEFREDDDANRQGTHRPRAATLTAPLGGGVGIGYGGVPGAGAAAAGDSFFDSDCEDDEDGSFSSASSTTGSVDVQHQLQGQEHQPRVGSGDSLDTDLGTVAVGNDFLNQVLEVRVYADKKMGPKSFLGMAEVHLMHLAASGEIVQTKVLGPSKSKRHYGRGNISVLVTAMGPGVLQLNGGDDRTLRQ